MSLVSVDQEKDELGPEVPKLTNLISPLSDSHLSLSQRTDLAYLQKRFVDVFSPLPGRTRLINHRIETTPEVSVRTRPYRLPEHKRKLVQAEIKAMLELGVIEESHSAWSSPIVLVWKPDRSIRFCVDYRKVNVPRFDAYPMPRVDKLLDRLGTAHFFSTLDLTKGYWQIPLSPESKEKWLSPHRMGYTNSGLFLSDYSGLQPRSNALWTECCARMLRLLQPIWMM